MENIKTLTPISYIIKFVRSIGQSGDFKIDMDLEKFLEDINKSYLDTIRTLTQLYIVGKKILKDKIL